MIQQIILYLHPTIHVSVEKATILKINNVIYYVVMDFMEIKIVTMEISLMEMDVQLLVKDKISLIVLMYIIKILCVN